MTSLLDFGFGVILFVLLIGLLIIGLWIWTLYDILTNKRVKGGAKVAWVLVIFFIPLLGSLLYLIFGRRG